MRDFRVLSRRDVLRMAGAVGGLVVTGVGQIRAQSAKKIESMAPELDRIISTGEPIRGSPPATVATSVPPRGRCGGRRAAIFCSTTFTPRGA